MPRWFSSFLFLLVVWHSGARAQDNRVKLCGREFIRMVVTSCGSSRLKRSTPESDQPRVNPYWKLLERLTSDELNDWEDPGTSVTTVTWSSPAGDLAGEPGPLPPRERTSSMSRVPRESRAEGDPSVPAQTFLPLTGSSRSRREVGPAGVCCRSGCTLSELVQYC
ncbi:insulin-like 3 (Leydig cell) [Lepisosteus oculatus]|uniref:insulin-like 3 (Leydig cell) n=1 Tax=Lepisosteus oculatus TaxID=7918 RepID=UPI0037220052